jgi:hypothetical protein
MEEGSQSGNLEANSLLESLPGTHNGNHELNFGANLSVSAHSSKASLQCV